MKRCDLCRHGINGTDPGGGRYVECALFPPAPVAVASGDGVSWLRPLMVVGGWCGQFKMSWLKLLFRYGART
jgi:hypothetical protein